MPRLSQVAASSQRPEVTAILVAAPYETRAKTAACSASITALACITQRGSSSSSAHRARSLRPWRIDFWLLADCEKGRRNPEKNPRLMRNLPTKEVKELLTGIRIVRL